MGATAELVDGRRTVVEAPVAWPAVALPLWGIPQCRFHYGAASRRSPEGVCRRFSDSTATTRLCVGCSGKSNAYRLSSCAHGNWSSRFAGCGHNGCGPRPWRPSRRIGGRVLVAGVGVRDGHLRKDATVKNAYDGPSLPGHGDHPCGQRFACAQHQKRPYIPSNT